MGLMAKVSQTHLERLLSCCHALSSCLWWGEDVSLPQATSSILSSRNVRLFLVQYIFIINLDNGSNYWIAGGSDDQFSSVTFTLTVFLGDKEIRCEPPQLEYSAIFTIWSVK